MFKNHIFENIPIFKKFFRFIFRFLIKNNVVHEKKQKNEEVKRKRKKSAEIGRPMAEIRAGMSVQIGRAHV